MSFVDSKQSLQTPEVLASQMRKPGYFLRESDPLPGVRPYGHMRVLHLRQVVNTEKLALQIRKHTIMMTQQGKSSHVGSVLSIADILAVLYGSILKKRPDEPAWPERDRFILSKGHASAGVYAILAETGYFSVDCLKQHCANGSTLCGHISNGNNPGVEFSTGSLGHGLPVGAGMSYAARLDKKNHRVYVLLSDGECDEGSNWEAILFAAHHRLSNLIAIIDYNKIQSLAPVDQTIRLEPFADKWRAFGWEVQEVNGHDHHELAKCLDIQPKKGEKPSCLIAHTTKGKGVSFMENSVLWHYRSPQGEEFQSAMEELEQQEHA